MYGYEIQKHESKNSYRILKVKELSYICEMTNYCFDTKEEAKLFIKDNYEKSTGAEQIT